MKKRLALMIAIAAVILSAVILFSFNVLAENESEAVPGDANGDGVINSQDLIRIRQYLAWYDYKTGTSSVELNADADTNSDGKIDVLDLARMRNYIVNGSFDFSEDSSDESEETTEAETEIPEPAQDNIFDANDFMAAYNYNTPEGFTGEIVCEDGITFFRATATEAVEGRLVLNSGKNAVANAGKSFVLVYRNKSASLNRVSLEINSAGKTDNVGGASPFCAISKTSEWSAVYFDTSNAVDLSAGAGYMSIDIFDEHDSVKVKVGDVIDIALFAAVDSTDTAKNTVGEYCGSFIEFPYAIYLNGVYVYGAEHTTNGVLLSSKSMKSAPVSMDLSNLPISGTLTNALRLGSGWAITRGGWDHYECKITASDGTAKTITIVAPEKMTDLGESTLNSLTSYDYGADKGVGGSLFNRIAIDLTGYEGETLTLEVYGISNYGMSYKLADIKNVKIPGVDNTFDAHDFYVSYKNMSSPAYTGELITENGLTFFRATATASGNGRLTLNNGTKAVENFGKSYILVYRNSSASTSQKFQLYVTAASGASETMIPAFTKANTSEWKVAVLNYTHDLDMADGAKSINVDLFFNNGVAGDVIDVALFVGANSEEDAWKIFGETVGDKIALPFRINVAGGVVVNATKYVGAPYLTSKTTMDNGPAQFDLSTVPAVSGDLKTAFRLGSTWVITREGWDYYYCNIIAESGKTATVRASEGFDFAAGAYTSITQNDTYLATHGPNMAIGGDITTKAKTVYVDLTGFEGETVTLEIFGVSNYGMHYEIVKVKNLQVSGNLEYEELDDFVSFVDPTVTGDLKILSLIGGNTAGVSFTVPEGEEVRSLKIALSNTTAAKACSAGISVYSFNGSYAESVKTTPVFTTTATSVMKWVDIAIPDGTMPAGDYLVVVKYVPVTGGVFTSAILDNVWSTLPEELAKYNIVAYRNGEIDSEKVLAGGFETVTVGATIPANDKIDVAFEDTTAKVIVISGQSNAAGATSSSIFKSKIGAEEYAKYANGFSNVKILYKCGSNGTTITYNNVSNGFVDVKIGQGYLTSTFGPELGLAAYLAENYPDETFYIIKYAVGSTSMQGHYNVNSNSDSQKVCLNGLKETVDNGIKLLEEMGLTPKIVGFLWMQGEGDAGTHANRASTYYTMQKALMSYLRDTYSDYSVDEGEIPFIDAEISDSGFWGASYVVNDSKKDIDRESARNYLIDTNYVGLTTLHENNDPAHYDSGSMILLGELYAKTLCDIYDFSK